MDKFKFYLTGSLDKINENKKIQKEAASVLDFPDDTKEQVDLAYFNSIFVSAGTNLNYATFLHKELIDAYGSVVSKAVDIEHQEDKIVGHIYKSEFVNDENEVIPIDDLKATEEETLKSEELHIAIGSVVYMDRFPEIVKEIAANKMSVSMECYYKFFDVMVGSHIMSVEEAELMGINVSDEALYGQAAKVIKDKKEIAAGIISKVLRGIHFAGVGIVENPANPKSVILEVASDKTVVFDMDSINTDNNVTSSNIEENVIKEIALESVDDYPGVCVSYKPEVIDSNVKDQNSTVLHTNWCSMYNTECTTGGSGSDPKCIRYSISDTVQEIASSYLSTYDYNNKIEDLITKIEDKIV